MRCPSGDQIGSPSVPAVPVRLTGFEPFASATQILPCPTNATLVPSGDHRAPSVPSAPARFERFIVDEPSRDIEKTSRFPVRLETKAKLAPSGDQSRGPWPSWPTVRLTGEPEPADAAEKIVHGPLLGGAAAYATRDPSGDHWGCQRNEVLLDTSRALAPSASMIHMEVPFLAVTMRAPSGDHSGQMSVSIPLETGCSRKSFRLIR